jgi:hypothetical protein
MMHYFYLPIVFWPLLTGYGEDTPVYVRYEPTMVYGLDNESPFTYYTDDSEELDYQPYTHHFFPEDGSESWEGDKQDSCYEPTK